MADDREDRIRKRAHAIWEKEGHSHGSAQRHWEQATADIDAEDSAASPPAKKAPAAARKPAAAKKPAAPKKPAKKT